MTKEEYLQGIKEIESKMDLLKTDLMKEYVKSNNPYKKGDIVTDGIGSLRIESMGFSWGYVSPCAVYRGIELKKDGSECKKQTGRTVFQSNILRHEQRM